MLKFAIAILSLCALTAHANPIPQDTALAHYVPIEVKTSDGLTLEGNLALPKNATPPYPAVAMFVGTGAGDRYENIPGIVTSDGKDSLLFKSLEQAFLEDGVAVLVYDKRGVSAVDDQFMKVSVDWNIFSSATAESFASDAVSAFDTLAAYPGIDKDRLGILGHSEGTLLALKVAERRPDLVKQIFALGLLARSWTDLFFYQGVTQPIRQFAVMDLDGNGQLSQEEFTAALTAEPSLAQAFGTWPQFVQTFDRTGDGQVTDQEFRYFLETQIKLFFHLIQDPTQKWDDRYSRDFYAQYIAEGAYLERFSALCSKLHLFQGEVDIQTPFEDALELNDTCSARGAPLASFDTFPGDGHGFSPRVGYRLIRDTIGPIDARVPERLKIQAHSL